MGFRNLGFLVLLLFAPVFTAAQSACDLSRADLNCSGSLGAGDLDLLEDWVYRGIPPPCGNGDLNCDGFRDATDLAKMLWYFYSGICDSCPSPPVRPTEADPRDSIILESHTVAAGNGRPYMTIRVWITNKDTLIGVSLPLMEKSVSGNAYAVLATPREYFFAFYPSTSKLNLVSIGLADETFYDGSSPDSFVIATFGSTVPYIFNAIPPNNTRIQLWWIHFDTVRGDWGQVVFDSLPQSAIQFVDVNRNRVPVNFLKGVVTVNCASMKGDMNSDANLSPADVVLMLNCVFLATGSCDLCFADLDCSGGLSPVDVMIGLNMVFLAVSPPC